MIARCRKAGLKEPQFNLTDGFVITLRRKPGRAFKAVGGNEEQPEFITSPALVQYQSLQERILALLNKEALPVSFIQKQLGQKKVSGQLKVVLNKLLKDELVAFTIPEKPNSRLQKYKLTTKGRASLDKKKFAKK